MKSDLAPDKMLASKDRRALERMRVLMRYWPDRNLYHKLLFSLLRFPREFKEVRSEMHLSRMVCSEYFYKRNLIKEVGRYPRKRHLFVKLLRTKLEYPFGSKSVLGIVVVFNLLKQREVFDEQHMIEAVKRLVPDAQAIHGSFYDYLDKQHQVQSVYLEVEKEGEKFTADEIHSLKSKLPTELKGCVEQLVPMTFMRRNEEEVYRNILALRDQLKSVRDIPQATITFEEQTQFDLFFTVVVLRLVKEGDLTVRTLFEQANPDMVYIPDRIDPVGILRKTHKKEATVFRLQLPKSQFYRKDRSVNLYTARRYVVARLSKALGHVRDYNGGLILKQNERLEDFLSIMPKFYDEFLLENFFYSITPIAMQSILPAALIKEWFLAFSALMDQEPGRKKPYAVTFQNSDDALLVIVRAEEDSFKEELLAKINQFEIPSLELAFSEIKMNGFFCFGFLYRPSQFGREVNFSKRIEEVMEQWSQKRCNTQVLSLSLHENDPSLDPRITKADQSNIVIKMLFDGLTRIGVDGKPQLALAQSYDVSTNMKTYTFHLRDAKWSNGAKVTAFDFEYSWKKALNPNSVFASTFHMIRNARDARDGKCSFDEVGVRALDARTLQVELAYPVPYFLEIVAQWSYAVINSTIDRKYPGWAYQAGETYVCNGPFRLVEWKHNRSITLEKNPHYWDADAVNLNKISITLIGREQNEVRMLQSGELDIVGRPMGPLPNTKGIDLEGIEEVSFPLSGSYAITFNTAQFPFNHKKLRQAFCYAIHRDVSSVLPSELSFSDTPLFPRRDLARARALFREGLGEIGFVRSDFPKLTLLYSGRYDLSSYVEQWKEAFGIEVHLQQLEWKHYFEQLMQKRYQFGGIELKPLWGDPLHMLTNFYHRGDALNLSAWQHPRYKKLIEEAKRVPEKRHELLRQAEEMLAEEMPMVPLHPLQGGYLKRRGLKGEFPTEYFQIDFKWAYRET